MDEGTVQDGPGVQADELSVLRERVDRLEREVAELRFGRSAEGMRPAPPPRVQPAVAQDNATSPAFPLVSEAGPRTSMEDRVGSEWFSRIGVVALLVATALFLKLAIDKHWLGPVGRIVCGLMGGGAVIVWSERFRRQGVTAFSYALKAVGSGVLYLTLWAAFHIYHLLPEPVTLAAMVLVTAWNAYMAWSQEAELLAVYALAGGLLTPRLLATGGNHEAFLFTYLLAIDLATVALVRLKPWPRLLLGSFPATVAYFIGWYSEFYHPDELWTTTAFLVLFGVVLGSVPVGAKTRVPLDALLGGVLLPLANAAFIALGLYSVLQDAGHHAWLPWLVLTLSAVYLGAMRLPQSSVPAAVHLSLAVVFLTEAIPLKATGRGIVIGWLIEGAALLTVSARLRTADRTARRVLRSLGCMVLVLGFAGVVSAPMWFYPAPSMAFLNWRFGTGLIGMAAFGCAMWVALRAHPDDEDQPPQWPAIAAVASVAFNLVAIWAVVQEIAVFWRSTAGDPDASLRKALAISAFLMVYGAAVLAVGFWRRSAFVRWEGLVLLVFTIGKTFLFDTRSLSEGYRVISFLALGVLLLGVSFAYQRDWLGLRQPDAAIDSRLEMP